MEQVRWDGDEDACSGGQSLSRSVGERALNMVATTGSTEVARCQDKGLAERNRTQVLNVEGSGHRDDSAGAIGLAHCLIEESRDDASMSVARRTSKSRGEAKAADDVLVGIGEEAKAKAGSVVEAASEAVLQGAVGERGEAGPFA